MNFRPAPIAFDYHSHHYRCGHATGNMGDYVAAAIEAGMVEFGVSDHGPAYFEAGDHARPGTQMAVSELGRYVDEACAVRAQVANRIRVRVGVEADYIEGREEDLRALLASQPFEYVLGSVHFAGGTSIFNRAFWQHARMVPHEAERIYRDYYRLVARAAQSGLFDTLSHLTAVEAFGPPIADALADELYPPAADAVAASGCLVEVNTSGFRKMGGDEPFPNRRMLRLLIARGVGLTFGSDCHKPAEVGFGRERVLALLRDLGVDSEAAPTATRRGTLWAFATGGAR